MDSMHSKRWLLFFILASGAAFAFCSPSDPPADGDGDGDGDTDGDTDGDGDADCPEECCDDEDCANGLTCDGDEVCDRGICEPGPPFPCGPEQMCDEELDACVCAPDCGVRECGLDPRCDESCGDCPADEVCNDEGRCVCAEPCDGGCCTGGERCCDGVCQVVTCDDRECGSDGCGGTCPSTCEEGDRCLFAIGRCCTPGCGDLECGVPICTGDCMPLNGECNPVRQECCEAGERCTLANPGTGLTESCEPAGSTPHGTACSGSDAANECAAGTFCHDTLRLCLQFCRDVTGCPTDRTYTCSFVGSVLGPHSVCVPH